MLIRYILLIAGETGMFVGAIKQNYPTCQYHGYLNQDESQSKIIYDVFNKWDQAFVSGTKYE